MSSISIADLIAMISGLGGLVVSVLYSLYQISKRNAEVAKLKAEKNSEEAGADKTQAEAANLIVESSRQLLETYKLENQEIREKHVAMSEEVEAIAQMFAQKSAFLEREVAAIKADLEKSKEEISALKTALEERDRMIVDLLAGIDRLIHQIKSLGAEPVWRPRKAKTNE